MLNLENLLENLEEEISTRDVKTWGTKHVTAWIKMLNFEEEEEKILVSALKASKTDGKLLDSVSDNDLNRVLGDHLNQFARDKFLVNLHKVQQTRTFKKPWTNVFSKLVRTFKSKKVKSFKEVEGYADMLASRNAFHEEYFSFFVNVFKYEEIKDEDEEEAEFLIKKINMDYQRMAKKDFFQGKQQRVKLVNYDIQRDEKRWKIPCKIVITDIFERGANPMKTVRAIMSPLMQIMRQKKRGKFGLFHAAIIIGPWYLEWNAGELIIPRKCFGSSKAIICHDVPHTFHESHDIRGMVRKISKIAYKWNTGYSYAKFASKGKGNCQHFVDDLLRELAVDGHSLKEGYLGKFLKALRNKGSAELEFSPKKEFSKAFDLDSKKFNFKTHVDLDIFVDKLMKKRVSGFEGKKDAKFRGEYNFLKSFDRAFWLKHFRFPDMEEFKPLESISKESDGFDESDSEDEDE